eukprot:2425983-Rhodomonas_salina.1
MKLQSASRELGPISQMRDNAEVLHPSDRGYENRFENGCSAVPGYGCRGGSTGANLAQYHNCILCVFRLERQDQ